MLFSLARRGDAPKSLLEINRRGVPVKAILLTSSIGFLSTGWRTSRPRRSSSSW